MTALLRHRLAWPTLVLVALLVGDLLLTDNFFSITLRQGHLYGNVIDILRNGAPLAIVGIGMTVVIATGGIDLSVGSVIALSGALAVHQVSKLQDQNSTSGVLLACGTALVAATLCGLWNGVLVAVLRIQPIVATLILMVGGRGLAQLISDGQIITITSAPYAVIGAGYWLTFPVGVAIAAVVVLVAVIVSRRTAFGLLLESVGGNAEASRLAGVRSRGIVLLTYMFSGFCAGIAGIMISSNVASANANVMGLFFELDAILAVVIGGTALIGGRYYLAGTVVGAAVISTLTTTILTTGIPPETTLLFKALVVIAVCLLQSPAFRTKVTRLGRRSAPPEVPATGASATDQTKPEVTV